VASSSSSSIDDRVRVDDRFDIRKPDWGEEIWAVFPPISPEGIARVPPHPAGTSPGRRAPPRGLFVLQHQDTKPAAGPERICTRLWEPPDLARRNKSFATCTRCDDRATQCPLATGFPRSFGPKGKHSFHHALTNYLSNDSPSYTPTQRVK
jgi:hypothetical protein